MKRDRKGLEREKRKRREKVKEGKAVYVGGVLVGVRREVRKG